MSAQGGIQELMAAEARASTIVSDARAARTQRIREAKLEAEALAKSYSAEKEETYQASMQQSKGSSGQDSANLEKETEGALQKMKSDFEANKEKVAGLLVYEACHVELVVPEGRKSRDMPKA